MPHKEIDINQKLLMPLSKNFDIEAIRQVLERFEKEETILLKSGKRVMDSFRKLMRRQMGLKDDYTLLTFEEKMAEAVNKIRRDFKVAREEIKYRNPVDYLLDRALDPLDPMNAVYKVILTKMGAQVDENTNAIRLSKELNALLRKGITMEHHNQLPTFNGYAVDRRLKEFRKMELGQVPEFIPFDSDKGKALSKEMERFKELSFVEFDSKNTISRHFKGNTLIAKVEHVSFDKKRHLVNIRFEAGNDRFELMVKETLAGNIKPGCQIAIIKKPEGIKIHLLGIHKGNSLKR